MHVQLHDVHGQRAFLLDWYPYGSFLWCVSVETPPAAFTAGLWTAPDPMFVLVMLIQNCVPTALNVHTLAVLHNNREAEMATLLFWEYISSVITIPGFLFLFLYLVQTYDFSKSP